MITFLTPFWRRDALGHSHPYLAFIRKKGVLPLSYPPPVLEGRLEDCHDPCPSSLEEWVSVAMVTPIPLSPPPLF